MSNSDDGKYPTVTEPVHDLYLRMLIMMLETDESGQASASITLVTHGGVVYGDLITKDSWKTLWADQMKTATGSGVEAFRNFPDSVDSALQQVLEESDGQQDTDDGMRYFVHLKDATLFVPGAGRIGAPIWRGRLDSITGWSIGTPG